MLQQTQVDRVREKYEKFLSRFPDVESLAGAAKEEVLTAWKGLGYNRRALALGKLARRVMEVHDGQIPRDVDALAALPGIGKATAGAVAAFAFNLPVVFVETNIRRVFIHHFFGDRDAVTDKEILPFVEMTLHRENPREWYYALMDYGAMLGRTTVNPNRKSARYRVQGPFRNSRRQLRGEIIRILLAEPGLTAEELAMKVDRRTEDLPAVLTALEKEGFVKERGGAYTIA
jgi:A/G-specific adenine glycosylase